LKRKEREMKKVSMTECYTGASFFVMSDEEISQFLKKVQVGQIVRINFLEQGLFTAGAYVSPVLGKRRCGWLRHAPKYIVRILLSHAVELKPTISFHDKRGFGHWSLYVSDGREWGKVVRVTIHPEFISGSNYDDAKD
jgi:hypothetical protein